MEHSVSVLSVNHLQVAHSTQSMSVPHTHYPSLVTTSVAQWNAAHANPVDDEEDTRVVVEEEVFENERFQPFRGWGSLWPGHFLPSDRIGRFGDRQVGASLILRQGWMFGWVWASHIIMVLDVLLAGLSSGAG